MNKSRLGLIVNMLLTPFIEKEFLREGGDCIENLAEAYHDAWCTDITDYYRRVRFEAQYETRKLEMEGYIVNRRNTKTITVDDAMMILRLFYPMDEMNNYLCRYGTGSLSGYYVGKLYEIAISLLTFRDGRIAIRTWLNEQSESGKRDIFDYHDAFDKVEIWNILSRLIVPDVIIAAFFVEAGLEDRNYLYGQNGGVYLADKTLSAVLARGVAENHMHFNVGIEYSVLWKYLTNIWRWEVYFNGTEEWNFKIDQVLLFAAVVYRYLYASYMEMGSKEISFYSYIEEFLPETEKQLQELLHDLKCGIEGKELSYYREFYYMFLQHIKNAWEIRETDDFLLDTVYKAEIGLKTSSEMIFLVQTLQWLRNGQNTLEEQLFMQYIRIKNGYFQQFVQPNHILGQNYFFRFFGTARNAEKFGGKNSSYIYREIFKSQAQNINIKKLEIRITPDFVLANKNGIQEYELAERSLKKSILSNVRNVIVEYIEYCKMIVNHDGDAENWYTQLDRCYENGQGVFPSIGIVYHFQKRDYLDNKIGDMCWLKYAQSGTAPAYSKHLLVWRKQIVNCARAMEELRSSIPYLAEYIVGIDAASNENSMEPWMLAPAYRTIRNRKITKPLIVNGNGIFLRIPNIGFTYHVGEEFRHIMSGLRHISEVMEHFNYKAGDRLGHAIALGVDVDQWVRENEVITIPAMEHLENLLWLWGSIVQKKLIVHLEVEQLEGQIMMCAEKIFEDCTGMTAYMLYQAYLEKFNENHENIFKEFKDTCREETIPQENPAKAHFCYWYDAERHGTGQLWTKEKILCTYYCPLYFMRFQQPIFVPIMEDEAVVYKEVQQQLIEKVERDGIFVETNPTSNIAIGEIDGLFKHYIMRLNSAGLEYKDPQEAVLVTVNADDPVVFSTNTENELAYIYYALVHAGYKKEKILEWMEKVRKYGMDGSFIKKVKKPSTQIKEMEVILESISNYLKNI